MWPVRVLCLSPSMRRNAQGAVIALQAAISPEQNSLYEIPTFRLPRPIRPSSSPVPLYGASNPSGTWYSEPKMGGVQLLSGGYVSWKRRPSDVGPPGPMPSKLMGSMSLPISSCSLRGLSAVRNCCNDQNMNVGSVG